VGVGAYAYHKHNEKDEHEQVSGIHLFFLDTKVYRLLLETSEAGAVPI
jgi:hypothetical protein